MKDNSGDVIRVESKNDAPLPSVSTISIPVDRISELYKGTISTVETAEIARSRIHWMCGVCVGNRVLDVGCSQGITSILLARKGFTVTAIEAHPESVEFAKDEIEKEIPTTQERIELLGTDLFNLPVEELFDSVVLGEILEHQAVPLRFVERVLSHTVAGGKIIITTPFGLHPHPDHKSILLPSTIVEIASKLHLKLNVLDVVDGYIRCLLINEKPKEENESASNTLLPITESGTLYIQERLYGRLDKSSNQLKKFKGVNKSLQKDILEATTTVKNNARAFDEQKTAIEEAFVSKINKIENEHALDLKILNEGAENEISSLKEIYSKEVNEYKQEIEAQKTEHLQEIEAQKTEHLQEIEAHKTEHLQGIDAQKTEHLQEIEAQKTEHLQGIEAQKTEYLQEIEAQMTEYLQEIEAQKTEFLQEIEAQKTEFLQEIEAQKTEHFREIEALNTQFHENTTLLIKEKDDEANSIHDTFQELIKNEIAAREEDVSRHRLAALNSQQKIESVQNTLSFRLGNLLIMGPKSIKGLLSMPMALFALWSEAKRRRKANSGTSPSLSHLSKQELESQYLHPMLDLYGEKGTQAALDYVVSEINTAEGRAYLYTQLAKIIRSTDPVAACEIGELANSEDPRPFRAKWLSFLNYDCGNVKEAMRLLESLPEDIDLQPSERSKIEQVRSYSRIAENGIAIPPITTAAYEPEIGSVLYVAASALPFHVSGYTVRTQSVLEAIQQEGWKINCQMRPGYPEDRPDSLVSTIEDQHIVGNITYMRASGAYRRKDGLDIFVQQAASAIEVVARRQRSAVIHAASNHENALPALIAARRLGVPFVYEVRGLWELTAASKKVDWENTDFFKTSKELEVLVASNADQILTITQALADELITRGVPASRIALAPNVVDPEKFSPRVKDQSLANELNLPADVFTVVYVGSIVNYEGLDDLIRAVSSLKRDGIVVNAVFVGDGETLLSLKSLAEDLHVSSQVRFVGRVNPEEAVRYWSLSDAVVIPRKSFKVCQLIAPLKPVEAMAMGKAMVVSDLPALREMVSQDQTGMLFPAGDVSALASCLARLVLDPAMCLRIGQAAKEYVLAERTISVLGKKICARYDDLLNRHQGQVDAGRDSMSALVAVPLPDEATQFVDAFHAEGLAGVETLIERMAQGQSAKFKATLMLRAGKSLVNAGDGDVEFVLAEKALAADRSESILRGCVWVAKRTKNPSQACDMLLDLEVDLRSIYGSEPTEQKQAILGKITSTPAYLLSVLKNATPESVDFIPRISNRICYILHNSLPYSSGGYATRSHGVAIGLKQAGKEVIILSRPGFPLDTKPELNENDIKPIDTVDDITFIRTIEPQRKVTPEGKGLTARWYIPAAADALEVRFREYRPETVIAASNYLTALPALIAARRLGIPFIYEIRGLWEITRMSRDSNFEDSASFHVQKMMEGSVAKLADHVFTLTEPMREEMQQRGVPSSHIDLLPNSCDPKRFLPTVRNEQLAMQLGLPKDVPVIGYIGTFVDYEGLENLAEACALLKQRGTEFRLLLVGNENASGQDRGPITEEIARIAEEYDFSDWVIMPGRVPHEEVENYYSLVDMAPFPRKPWPVCEMVSPMKPLEALSMEKAVVVSSVRALVEMIEHEKTGLVFEKGSVESLAATLKQLIDSPDLRKQLGIQGRKWVEQERTWQQIGNKAVEVIEQIVIPGIDRANTMEKSTVGDYPLWWGDIEPHFASKCQVVRIDKWQCSDLTDYLRQKYVDKFGEDIIKKRIPQLNLARADYLANHIPQSGTIMDVGSGLGEFVNLIALKDRHEHITSVDIKDYDLYFDLSGDLHRNHTNIFDLRPNDGVFDTVTCFEVVEHLPPSRIREVVSILKSMATKKVFVSVPFKEPLPLYRGHFTQFNEALISDLFGECKRTIFVKNGSKSIKAWILCEIDIEKSARISTNNFAIQR